MATDNRCIAQCLHHHNTSSVDPKDQDLRDKWYSRHRSNKVDPKEVDLMTVTIRAKHNDKDNRIWDLIHARVAAVRRAMGGSNSQRLGDRYCIFVSFSSSTSENREEQYAKLFDSTSIIHVPSSDTRRAIFLQGRHAGGIETSG